MWRVSVSSRTGSSSRWAGSSCAFAAKRAGREAESLGARAGWLQGFPDGVTLARFALVRFVIMTFPRLTASAEAGAGSTKHVRQLSGVAFLSRPSYIGPRHTRQFHCIPATCSLGVRHRDSESKVPREFSYPRARYYPSSTSIRTCGRKAGRRGASSSLQILRQRGGNSENGIRDMILSRKWPLGPIGCRLQANVEPLLAANTATSRAPIRPLLSA